MPPVPRKKTVVLVRPNGKTSTAEIEPAAPRRGARPAPAPASNVVQFDRLLEGIKGDAKLAEIIENAMREYGAMTVEARAINDYRDGLKPVHRRILWTMLKMGLKSSGGYRKCAKVVGDCFAAGTPVSTPQGPVAIEHLQIGDEVITSQGVRRVTKTFANPPAPMGSLVLANGKAVVLTPDQEVKIKIGDKFYWKPACELTAHDQVVVE